MNELIRPEGCTCPDYELAPLYGFPPILDLRCAVHGWKDELLELIGLPPRNVLPKSPQAPED